MAHGWSEEPQNRSEEMGLTLEEGKTVLSQVQACMVRV
jgi:hypothetical protein